VVRVLVFNVYVKLQVSYSNQFVCIDYVRIVAAEGKQVFKPFPVKSLKVKMKLKISESNLSEIQADSKALDYSGLFQLFYFV